jgi:hypothetical protein
MIWIAVSAVVVLGGFCAVLYLGQEKRQERHDAQVAKLVKQITRTNPADATLEAITITSEVLTNAVDKVTSTIGTSFASATGLAPVGDTVVSPPDPEPDDDELQWPDVELDGRFVSPDLPSGNGTISPPVMQ